MNPQYEIRRHTRAAPWTYPQLDARQRELAEGVRRGGEPVLLLSEVASVITYGRRTPASDILLPASDILLPAVKLATPPVNRATSAASQATPAANPPTFSGPSEYPPPHRLETYATDRGGYATYHGPGQWVLFPVGRLEHLVGDSRGIHKLIQALLEIALHLGQLYDSTAHIRTGCELGVWTAHGKFAAVGIHVQQGVVLHGLSVNGFRTSESFQGLRPCGLDAPVDFLLKNFSLSHPPLKEQELEFELLGQRLLAFAVEFVVGGGRGPQGYKT